MRFVHARYELFFFFPPSHGAPQELTPPDFALLGCWHVPHLIRANNPAPGNLRRLLTLAGSAPLLVHESSAPRTLEVHMSVCLRQQSCFFLRDAFAFGRFYDNFIFKEERVPSSRHHRHHFNNVPTSSLDDRVESLNLKPFSPLSVCSPVILSLSTQCPAIHP